MPKPRLWSNEQDAADRSAMMATKLADTPGVLTRSLHDIGCADLGAAAAMLGQLPAWIADCNGVAAHSALGYYLAPR